MGADAGAAGISTVAQFKEEVEQQSSDAFAVLDRNDLSSEGWRQVILECNEKDLQRVWYLKDENGALLDEPEAGCPASGFSEESLINDIGLEYYCVPPPRADPPLPPPVEPNGVPGLPDELDNCRVRLTATGATGTTRTRDGSNDTAMPNTKVAVIFDNTPASWVLLRPDELPQAVTVLTPESDLVPKVQRASLPLRKPNSTKAEGTLLGEVAVSFTAPKDVTELEVFAGVHLAGRDAPMMAGQKVFAHAATAAGRGWVAECAVCRHEGVGVSVRGDASSSVCMCEPVRGVVCVKVGRQSQLADRIIDATARCASSVARARALCSARVPCALLSLRACSAACRPLVYLLRHPLLARRNLPTSQ